MFNEPPYAERHVRWCEGTGNQIMITFLLDAEKIYFVRLTTLFRSAQLQKMC